MTKHSEAGKGSSMRPTDHDAFSKNFEAIFGAKPKKDSIWPFPPKLIPHDHKLPKFNPNNIEDAPL
jgi:hypothetical protein